MKISRLTPTLVFVAITLPVMLIAALTLLAQSNPQDPEKDKQRAEIRKMAQEKMKNLYKVQPSAEGAVRRGAGYAVFSNTGVKILVAGSGKGHGLAVNNRTQQETFMKMLELQAGLGFGVKKFTLIFVFENETAFNGFVNSGWEFGGQATAAAKVGGQGAGLAGAASVSEGVWLYQLTDKGLALEITAKSTKFSKNDDLN